MQIVAIKARVPGYLQAIGFTDGQNVEAGQALFMIDPRPYQAALDRQGPDRAAQAQLRLAQLDQQRAAKLVSTSAIAKATLDQRDAELSEAGASARPGQGAMRAMPSSISASPRSPHRSRVASPTGASMSAIWSTDRRALTTIVAARSDLSELRHVGAGFPRLSARRGQRRPALDPQQARPSSQAHLVDEDGWPHQGTMNFVDNVVDQGSGTIRGRAVFPNPDGLITPGQFGRVRIPGSPEYDAILIPDAAIVTDQSRKMVLTVDGDNVVRPKIIRPGPSQPGGLRIVRRGLDARRPHHHQWPDPRPARGQGDAQGRQDRARDHRAGGRLSMRFSHFFVDRPIFAAVVSIIITLIGGIAYFTLPVAQYPEVAPPTVVVSASYPGASAEVVAETVATPLEQEINGVENMLYMVSQSTGDGNVQITITFALGTDLDEAQVLVQNRVAIAEPQLPEEVRRLRHHDQEELARPDDGDPSQLAGRVARPALHLQLRHPADQGRAGPPARRRRHPDLRRARLLDARLARSRAHGRARPHRHATSSTPSQAQNVQVASGALNQVPVPNPGAFQLSVETLGRLPGRRAVREHHRQDRRRRPDHPGPRRGRIELGAQDYLRNAYLDERTAAALGSSSCPARTRWPPPTEVKRTMEELRRDFPKGLDYDIIYNPTEFIQQSVHEVQKTIFEAVALVVVVVILFLQTWRAAIIPIVAIPVSLIGTFAVMAALGFSPEQPLPVRAGAGDRHRRRRRDRRGRERRAQPAPGLVAQEAAHRTMDEVGGALIAIALVLCGRVHADRLITGISGPVLSPVRGHHRRLDGDLLRGLADLSPGPVRAAAQAARGAPEASAADRADPGFFNGFNWLFDGLRTATAA